MGGSRLVIRVGDGWIPGSDPWRLQRDDAATMIV
jgi:hypothetical protein